MMHLPTKESLNDEELFVTRLRVARTYKKKYVTEVDWYSEKICDRYDNKTGKEEVEEEGEVKDSFELEDQGCTNEEV